MELQARQLGVKSTLGDEALMGSFLDNATVFKHENSVSLEDGCQAMGDDERRAVFHQPVKRALYQRFAFGIERGGRLI
ncbi:hypothetical protein D3C73_856170 [compost metagenome]